MVARLIAFVASVVALVAVVFAYKTTDPGTRAYYWFVFVAFLVPLVVLLLSKRGGAAPVPKRPCPYCSDLIAITSKSCPTCHRLMSQAWAERHRDRDRI